MGVDIARLGSVGRGVAEETWSEHTHTDILSQIVLLHIFDVIKYFVSLLRILCCVWLMLVVALGCLLIYC